MYCTARRAKGRVAAAGSVGQAYGRQWPGGGSDARGVLPSSMPAGGSCHVEAVCSLFRQHLDLQQMKRRTKRRIPATHAAMATTISDVLLRPEDFFDFFPEGEGSFSQSSTSRRQTWSVTGKQNATPAPQA